MIVYMLGLVAFYPWRHLVVNTVEVAVCASLTILCAITLSYADWGDGKFDGEMQVWALLFSFLPCVFFGGAAAETFFGISKHFAPEMSLDLLQGVFSDFGSETLS